MMYFVWVSTIQGPTPQKWDGDMAMTPNGTSKLSAECVIAAFPLTDGQAELSLDELAELYELPTR